MKISWLFKQLFPLCYRSEHNANDKRYLTTYRMWFGKCFDVKTVEIKG